MKTIVNKYWLSDQRVTQRIAAQTFPTFVAPNVQLTTVRVRNLLASIPSWLILVMIILAVLGTASTVISRMQSELQFSANGNGFQPWRESAGSRLSLPHDCLKPRRLLPVHAPGRASAGRCSVAPSGFHLSALRSERGAPALASGASGQTGSGRPCGEF